MTGLKQILLVVAFMLSAIVINAQDWTGIIKVCAINRGASDNYGYSIAISGNWAIVGAPFEDEDANNENNLNSSGSAYILYNTEGVWLEYQKIVASDRAALDNFGFAVDIDGDYAIVGAYTEDENASGSDTKMNPGSAYIYKNIEGTWTQIEKIVASDRSADDNFGYSVSIDGNYAVVGAWYEDENEDGNETFTSAGSAYIFQNNSDNWTQIQKIVHSDRDGGDNFGCSLSISGDYIVVGANCEDENVAGGATLNESGSAYVFKKNGGTWEQLQKIVSADRDAADYFGHKVAIDGLNIIVGAYGDDEDANGSNVVDGAGAAYIFTLNAGTWTQAQKIVAPNRNVVGDRFGYSVAISNSYVIVGAYMEDEDEAEANSYSNAGAAYVFHKVNANWTQVQKIDASDRAMTDNFGFSVGISNGYAFVGAQSEDEDSIGANFMSGAGSVYFFDYPTEINLRQNTTQIADGGEFSFGVVYMDESSEALSFTVENIGGKDVVLSGDPLITVSGVDAADFIVDYSGLTSPITTDCNSTFTITFTPSVIGHRTAEISIVNNDANESVYNFAISGSGWATAVIQSLNNGNISVYPNPTDGFVNFDFDDVLIKNIKLTDLCGKVIFEKSNVLDEEIIDFSYLANGVYLVVMQTENQSYSLKLIKE